MEQIITDVPIGESENHGKDTHIGSLIDVEVFPGKVIDIRKGKAHGFIKPFKLPPKFNQTKDVFFHFSNVIGPKLEKDMVVIFKLNPDKLLKPEVKEVYLSSLTPEDVEKARVAHSIRNGNKDGTQFGMSKHSSSQFPDTSSKLHGDVVKKKGSFHQGFLYKYIGIVCSVKDEFGFLKPSSPLPEDYAQNKDVIFY